MKIQPIVIGTAGHIDHGKSTLVRSLTGIDPDRLKEEKERGLTIDLGFAPLELPDGRLVGIVDVPGHERFIRNMVAGASGIDLVVLVVASDDGVMPQTREHLEIMGLLGVERGLVALTKVDMVEPDMVDLAEEDVRENLEGTFLDGAPILRISAKTGEGMEDFKEVLFRMASEAEPRTAEGVFRMPIQRVFTKSGFGTVVTGIAVSGSVKVGDTLELLPSGARAKVRGLHAYREKTDVARAGHSTAINFSDADHRGLHRGDVVATPGYFSPRRMIAARLRALPSLDRRIENRMQVRLHTGTVDVPGEVILLDAKDLGPGEDGLVQLRLSQSVVVAAGDRFVLRLLSPVVTLGGGVILEESKHRLKRFRDFVIEGLARQEASLGSPAALLESILMRGDDPLAATDELAVAIKRPREETRELLAGLAAEERVRSPRQDRWIHMDRLESELIRVRSAVEAWFTSHPHRARMDVRDLRNDVRLDAGFLSILLEELVDRGRIEVLPGGLLALADHRPELHESDRRAAEELRAKLDAGRLQPPSPAELAEQLGLGREALDRILEFLVDAGEIERVHPELYLGRRAVDEARAAIVANCERNGHLEIPELRDALGTTRKFLLPVLDHFDTTGLTIRQGGHRILRR